MNAWIKTELKSSDTFEFSTPPETQEYELAGERQKDGRWNCRLTQFPGGIVNNRMPVTGTTLSEFASDSPENAKTRAEGLIAQNRKNQ